jgi:hypothetical protein
MTPTKILLLVTFAGSAVYAQNNLTTTGRQRYFDVVRRSLEGSVDVMPAEKYSFRLTEGQRTFAEWIVHSIQRNYSDCAMLKSVPVPDNEKQAVNLKEKGEVSKALKDSFAYCQTALDAIDDQKILASPQMTNAFLHLLVHSNEIYGNVVGYLRASGIVPPSTAGRGAATRKGNE